MLELVNAARLDPAAEALRLKVKLNAGLAVNTLDATAKQVLAPNQLLEQAATNHAQWMLANGSFSHTGVDGSTASVRATNASYLDVFLGESNNITPLTSPATLAKMIAKQVDTLFKSALDRANMLNGAANEIGVAQEQGTFGSGSNQASMVSQSFGDSAAKYVTGVAYNDINKDGKYSIGEGTGEVNLMSRFSTEWYAPSELAAATETGAAGGYALAVDAFQALIIGTTAAKDFAAVVDLLGNTKLDIVNGTTLAASSSINLVDSWHTGDQVLGADLATLEDEVVTAGVGTINNIRLLGIENLQAYGNVVANVMDGNKGGNIIAGNGGNDTINGNAGADYLLGGEGDDSLNGGSGNDSLLGDEGADNLNGWFGVDRVGGGDGADVLRGGLDKDTFIFNAGDDADLIMDFSARAKERLELDDMLWADAQGAPVALTGAQVVSTYAAVVSGKVVFDFGDGDVLTLAGVKSLTGLAALIDII